MAKTHVRPTSARLVGNQRRRLLVSEPPAGTREATGVTTAHWPGVRAGFPPAWETQRVWGAGGLVAESLLPSVVFFRGLPSQGLSPQPLT